MNAFYKESHMNEGGYKNDQKKGRSEAQGASKTFSIIFLERKKHNGQFLPHPEHLIAISAQQQGNGEPVTCHQPQDELSCFAATNLVGPSARLSTSNSHG